MGGETNGDHRTVLQWLELEFCYLWPFITGLSSSGQLGNVAKVSLSLNTMQNGPHIDRAGTL